jgi:hypothetical protein
LRVISAIASGSINRLTARLSISNSSLPTMRLIAIVYDSDESTGPFATTPTGYTRAQYAQTPTSSAQTTILFYKVAGASEPTTVTSTVVVSGELRLYEYAGWTGTPTLDQSSQADNFNASSTSLATPTLPTTTSAN